jgi:hypothetical protein
MRTCVLMAGAIGCLVGQLAACRSVANTCDVDQTCPARDGSTMAGGDSGSSIDAPDAAAPDDTGHEGGGPGVLDRNGDASVDANAAMVDGSADDGDGWICPAGADPKDQACVIDESMGVFVSPKGTPNGAGTKASPLKSIDAAITAAKSRTDAGAATRVYVCGGSYAESIVIDATRDGVQLFGGLSCADWSYTGEKTVLTASVQGIALTLSSLTNALFVDLEIDSQSAPQTAPTTASTSGASSIAVLANLAKGVEFRRDTIVAASAQPGASGTLTAFMFPQAADLLGNAASGASGGLAKALNCPGGLTTGGKGGDSPAGSGDPGLPALSGGAGGSTVQCVAGQGGFPGASAGVAANGSGAAATGTLGTGGVWHPSPGNPGNTGSPGQGGGGGGGVSPGGGGGGGAGGCGGAGGGAGGGGGASIAVVAFASELTFTDSTLVSGAAGSGGAGASGQPGQSQGGNGGLPDSTGGCPGGRGGAGGAGGAGGGGAGGISVGVLYKGATPTFDAMTLARFVAGQAGAKGSGGVPGINDGVDGVSAPSLAAQ